MGERPRSHNFSARVDSAAPLSHSLLVHHNYSAMILMFLGELTAPIMNVLRISQTAAKLDMTDSWLTNAHPILEYTFAVLYVLFRVFVGPICAAHLTYDLLTKEGRKNVPVQLSLLWLAMCWGVMLGSYPWIRNALRILASGGGAPVV